MSETRHIDVSATGDVTCVRFLERRILDELSIQEIGEELFALVERDGKTKIVLDFFDVGFLSSAALGKLITMDKKLKNRSGQLKLCGIHPEIMKVFEITRLNEVFDIKEDQEDALAAF